MKKVGAPKGNKNAEEWTLEKALVLFDLIMKKLNEKTTYMVNGKRVEGYLCHYLGEATDEADTTIDVVKYLRVKFTLESEYNRLKSKSERNCFTDTKKGIINTAVGIVNLKSNHGWTDRMDQTTKGEKTQTTIINLGSGTKPE